MMPQAIAELRSRLGVTTPDVSDELLDRCLNVSSSTIDPHVPAEARTSPLYGEAVQALAVRVYEERVRGRVGVGPDGEPVEDFTPGPTAGMVRSVWAYIGPLNQTGGLTA
jgi:hypothetical protein